MTGVALATHGLGVDFGGLRALDEVSLHVATGDVVGLIGPNGAGKTTLFDCVSGLVDATQGAIEVFGTDVTRSPPHVRARLGLGRTFQRPESFGSLTVLENVAVGPLARTARGAAMDIARSALADLDIEGHADTYTAGLPLGTARLVELARAIAVDPRLLLLDEPSSGLRHDERQRLTDAIGTLHGRGGRSLLIVEHDMDFVLGLSDYVYVLDFGRVIAEGAPDVVRADPIVRAAYLGEDLEHDDGPA